MKQRILLVDNNVSFRAAVREFLELRGFELHELEVFVLDSVTSANAQVDLATVDIRLINNEDEEDYSGLTLVKEDIPKIMLTAYPTVDEVRTVLSSEKETHMHGLPKPLLMPYPNFLQAFADALPRLTLCNGLSRFYRYCVAERWSFACSSFSAVLINFLLRQDIRNIVDHYSFSTRPHWLQRVAGFVEGRVPLLQFSPTI